MANRKIDAAIKAVLVAAVQKVLLFYQDDATSILNSIYIPFNGHNGAINLSNPAYKINILKSTSNIVRGQLTITFNHKNTIRRSMSNVSHDPVDLLYLFNNGWKNSAIIPNTTGSKYATSRSSTPPALGMPGDYVGDGYMNQFVDMFQSTHPEANVKLIAHDGIHTYKEPQGHWAHWVL